MTGAPLPGCQDARAWLHRSEKYRNFLFYVQIFIADESSLFRVFY
jgi:hypothetical protein